MTGCRIGTFRRRAGIRIAGIAFTRPVVTRRFIGTRRYRTTIGGSAAVAAVIFTRSYRIGTIGVRTARSGSAAVARPIFARRRICTFCRRAGIRIAGVTFARPVITRRFIGTRRYSTARSRITAVAAVVFTRGYRIGTVGFATSGRYRTAMAVPVFTDRLVRAGSRRTSR